MDDKRNWSCARLAGDLTVFVALPYSNTFGLQSKWVPTGSGAIDEPASRSSQDFKACQACCWIGQSAWTKWVNSQGKKIQGVTGVTFFEHVWLWLCFPKALQKGTLTYCFHPARRLPKLELPPKKILLILPPRLSLPLIRSWPTWRDMINTVNTLKISTHDDIHLLTCIVFCYVLLITYTRSLMG